MPINTVVTYVYLFFYFLISVNIGLAVFNFIPVPPLDGSKILMAFLPDKALYWIAQREQMISMGLFVVIMMGGFNGVLSRVDGLLYDVIIWLTNLPFLWAY